MSLLFLTWCSVAIIFILSSSNHCLTRVCHLKRQLSNCAALCNKLNVWTMLSSARKAELLSFGKRTECYICNLPIFSVFLVFGSEQDFISDCTSSWSLLSFLLMINVITLYSDLILFYIEPHLREIQG